MSEQAFQPPYPDGLSADNITAAASDTVKRRMGDSAEKVRREKSEVRS